MPARVCLYTPETTLTHVLDMHGLASSQTFSECQRRGSLNSLCMRHDGSEHVDDGFSS